MKILQNERIRSGIILLIYIIFIVAVLLFFSNSDSADSSENIVEDNNQKTENVEKSLFDVPSNYEYTVKVDDEKYEIYHQNSAEYFYDNDNNQYFINNNVDDDYKFLTKIKLSDIEKYINLSKLEYTSSYTSGLNLESYILDIKTFSSIYDTEIDIDDDIKIELYYEDTITKIVLDLTNYNNTEITITYNFN